MAQAFDVDYSRIQFTPDLMPTDVVGTTIFNLKTSEFTFNKGPIRGIRHIIKPTIGFNYTPDYTRAGLGYFQTVDT